jgi:hypothetical protein
MLGMALAEDPAERIKRDWDVIAYCARYGRADVSDWPMSQAKSFFQALTRIVIRENTQKDEDG